MCTSVYSLVIVLSILSPLSSIIIEFYQHSNLALFRGLPCIWLWLFWKPFPMGGGGGKPPPVPGLSGGKGGLPPGPPRGGSGPGRPMGEGAGDDLTLPPPTLRPEGGGGGRGPSETEITTVSWCLLKCCPGFPICCNF